MFKTFLIIFLVVAVLAVGGGGFYYFEIYQPQTYAASLLALYQKLERVGLQPQTSSLKDQTDYEHALAVLKKRIVLLESIQNELARIHAPKRMVAIEKEFADYLDFAHAQHAHAAPLTTFVKGASELQEVMKDMYGDHASGQNQIITIGDLQKVWEERFPKIQTLAEQLFSKEITELTNPSFKELKILWENANPAFDLMLKKIKIANPNLPMNQVEDIFTPSEAKQLAKNLTYLEEFTKKITDLITYYSAYDLLAFRYFPDVSSNESSNKALTFYQMIQKLKEEYAQ